MASNHEWTWSPEHSDYYYATTDATGNYTYHWAKALEGQTVPSSSQSRTQQPLQHGHHDPNRRDSANPPGFSTLMPGIYGTPGVFEELDQSYTVRTGSQARHFFKRGRVFSMLWAEAASETAARSYRMGTSDNTAITVGEFYRPNPTITPGRFQQRVFSQIRRFVVVSVGHGFVYACAISTYQGRGTLKFGCIPSEHAIVYLAGRYPVPFQGEIERGMTKEAIEIQPVDNTISIDPASRLRFGKTFPVEMNVKVKNIGKVTPEHMGRLISYWKQYTPGVNNDQDEMEGDDTPQPTPRPRPSSTYQSHGTTGYTTSGSAASSSQQHVYTSHVNYSPDAQDQAGTGASEGPSGYETTEQGYQNPQSNAYAAPQNYGHGQSWSGFAPPGNPGYPPQQYHG